MRRENTKTKIHLAFALLVAVSALSACATNQPYISSSVGTISLKSSSEHQFTYLRAYHHKNELVIYGKVNHSHSGPHTGETVVLQSKNSTGKQVYTTPIEVQKQSDHQRGWYGAGFRAQIPIEQLQNGALSLSFETPPIRSVSQTVSN